MDGKVLQRAILNTEDNIIQREIGCFSDEIIKANNIYCYADSYLLEDISYYLNQLYADLIVYDDKYQISSKINKDSLLIVVTKDGKDSGISNLIQMFKQNGGRIILLTSNRNVNYNDDVNEILGVNINKRDQEAANDNEVFRYLVKELFDEVMDKTIQYL